MKQSVNPVVFVSVIVVLIIVIGFFLIKAGQPPAPAKPPTAIQNPLSDPHSQQHIQGMMESMQKAHPHPQGTGQP